MTAALAAERAARESYGRLVALLAWRWRDLAAAEDALSDAFALALQRWPRDGVPDAPDAWLLTVAKRRLLQAARHARVEHDPAVLALFDDEPAAQAAPTVPDERLKLLFVCAHPALPEAVRAPLMLQAVLGLEAATIAQAWLVAPSAMSQRLVRAKAKIKATGIRYEEPEARELPDRLAAVLESIYGAYTIGTDTAATGADASASGPVAGLAAEALYLARLVAALQPRSAEAWGLVALMLFCEARRPAQFDAAGAFVPLLEQDTGRWDRALLAEAERCLWEAAQWRQPGAFQLEAAIQSAHCQRAYTGHVPWSAIVQLYATLVQHHPSIGAVVGHAVALAAVGQQDEGLAALDALPADAVAAYQPYWVARAHLLRSLGRYDDADAATSRAIGLTEDPRVKRYLTRPPPRSLTGTPSPPAPPSP